MIKQQIIEEFNSLGVPVLWSIIDLSNHRVQLLERELDELFENGERQSHLVVEETASIAKLLKKFVDEEGESIEISKSYESLVRKSEEFMKHFLQTNHGYLNSKDWLQVVQEAN